MRAFGKEARRSREGQRRKGDRPKLRSNKDPTGKARGLIHLMSDNNKQQGTSLGKRLALIGVAVVAVIAGVVVFIRKKRKEKALGTLEDEDEDI